MKPLLDQRSPLALTRNTPTSGGLAGLSAAVFLIRDAQMPGENIHILEELPVAGGVKSKMLV